MSREFPARLLEALPEHLAAQRWFSGAHAPASQDVSIIKNELLWAGGADHELWHLIIDVAGEGYQLVLGLRHNDEVAEFLHGHDGAVLGSADGVYAYDAVWDSELTKALLEVASGGEQSAARSRPMGAEQSNSSIVFDDRLIFKLFRRLRPGSNPDVEVTTALAAAGFDHVAAPLVHWRDDTYDLAFGQQFLSGGSEGWALALASLRNLYNSDDAVVPSDAGGDFAGEAERLGRVTAEMHVALQRVFGTADAAASRQNWRDLVDSLPGRLAAASAKVDRDLVGTAEPMLARLGEVTDPGPAIRVHGDYHLGQVMRTDLGWFVLDFEGEPLKSVEERLAPASPFKDVTGMLRSFNYASRHSLVERAVADWGAVLPSAEAWESHNRQAFLDGYLAHPEIGGLLPEAAASAAVMTGYELDKALYELEYELSHRPEWVPIPLDALGRLVQGGGGAG